MPRKPRLPNIRARRGTTLDVPVVEPSVIPEAPPAPVIETVSVVPDAPPAPAVELTILDAPPAPAVEHVVEVPPPPSPEPLTEVVTEQQVPDKFSIHFFNVLKQITFNDGQVVFEPHFHKICIYVRGAYKGVVKNLTPGKSMDIVQFPGMFRIGKVTIPTTLKTVDPLPDGVSINQFH